MNGSPGISSIETLQTARIGIPSALNSVYLALTEVMNDAKLLTLPQCSTTSGGLGFFWPWLCSVGTVQENSFSTAVTTAPSCFAVASKNISTVSLHGSEPLNSGGPAVLDPLAGLRSHLAVLAMVTSLGLNWNSRNPRSAPGLLPPGAGSGA